MAEARGKTGKGRGLTALDIAVIIILIAVVLSVALRLVWDRIFSADRKDCTVSFEVSAAKSAVGSLLAEGDAVMLPDGSRLGTLGAVSVTPAVFLATDASGGPVEARWPEDTLVDISGTLTAELYDRDGGFLTKGGLRICAGTVIVLHTRTADFQVTVTGVEPATE
jgi:hypothetical protein